MLKSKNLLDKIPNEIFCYIITFLDILSFVKYTLTCTYYYDYIYCNDKYFMWKIFENKNFNPLVFFLNRYQIVLIKNICNDKRVKFDTNTYSPIVQDIDFDNNIEDFISIRYLPNLVPIYTSSTQRKILNDAQSVKILKLSPNRCNFSGFTEIGWKGLTIDNLDKLIHITRFISGPLSKNQNEYDKFYFYEIKNDDYDFILYTKSSSYPIEYQQQLIRNNSNNFTLSTFFDENILMFKDFEEMKKSELVGKIFIVFRIRIGSSMYFEDQYY